MANPQGIAIPIDLRSDEAAAFAELLKRTSYENCLRRSNRLTRNGDSRDVVGAQAGREPVRRGGLRAAMKFAIGGPIRRCP